MITIDKLNDFGADTKEGLSRCFGKEDFYVRLVNMIPEDPNFAALQQAVAANDLDKAFEAAHALKGVLGNLSLTPMYDLVYEMTEQLRRREAADYNTPLEKLLAMREELKNM